VGERRRVPTGIWRSQPALRLRCVVRQAVACPDAQSAEVDEGTQRTQIAGCSGLTQNAAATQTRDVEDIVPYGDCCGNGHCLKP
ncbi:MAG: hypothetical protein LBO63_00900, partial [Oscillospiraceae bacterium]|nr:hypothetical protein [Oscillospiraceae bacterium]